MNHYLVDCKIIETIRRHKHIVKNHTNCPPAKFYRNSQTKFITSKPIQKKKYVLLSQYAPKIIATSEPLQATSFGPLRSAAGIARWGVQLLLEPGIRG